MPVDVKKIRAYYDQLAVEFSNWRALYSEIGELIHPRRSNVVKQVATPGAKQTAKLYDSTALHAKELLAASMNSAFTSSTTDWFGLRTQNDQLNKVSEVLLWLEECDHLMTKAFRESNFYSEVHEIYLDLCAFGTGALFVRERESPDQAFGGLLFRAISPGEYVIDENEEGMVDTLIRKYSLTVRQLAQSSPKFALTEEMLKDITENRLTNTYEIIHAVLPRSKFPGVSQSGTPWVSAYISLKDNHLLHEGGFFGFPYMVPRWAKSSGEKLGRGPGSIALPDVKSLNLAKKMLLSAWALTISPPTLRLENAVVGPIRLWPGGSTIVRNIQGLKAFESGTKFDVSQLNIEDLRGSVRQIFFSDQLQLQEGPQMTATEVYVRYELMQRLLGPTMGRLISELLSPLIKRVFMVMLLGRALPPPPPVLGDDWNKIEVQYEGPMAKAQRMGEVIAIQRFLQAITPIQQADPDCLDWIDFDMIVPLMIDVFGLPASTKRKKSQVEQLRMQRQQEAQQAKQMETMLAVAQAGRDISPLLKAAGTAGGAAGIPGGMAGSMGGRMTAGIEGARR